MRRVELLLTEMQDKYVRENIRRIKGYLQSLEERVGEGSSTTNITNNFSSSIWSREITEVASSSTESLDSIALSNFQTAKYIVSVFNSVANETSSFEMLVKNDGSGLTDTVYDKINGGVDYTIGAVINVSDMELRLTNNEANSLDVTIVRVGF